MRALIRILFIVGVLLALDSPCFAELRLSLSIPDSDRVILGEPVVALVRLSNNGADAVMVSSRLEPEAHRVRFFIQYEGEDAVAFRPWAFEETVSPFQELAPGQAVDSVAKLFFGSSGWTFRRPGRYRVRAIYAPDIEANAQVFVSAPQNASDEAAARLMLQSNEVGYFLLLEGGDTLKEAITTLENIVASGEGGRLAAYAHFALGRSQEVAFTNLVTGHVRPANLEVAAAHFRSAVPARMATYFELRARTRLAMVYRQLARPELALSVESDLAKYTAQPRGGISPGRMRVLLDKEKN